MVKTDLNELEIKILSLIREGSNTMAEIIDTVNIESERINKIVEKLDLDRYIEREGLIMEKFWQFALTPKGEEALPALPESEEKMLAEHGVIQKDIDMLRKVERSGKIGSIALIAGEGRVELDVQLDLNKSIVKLLKYGYLNQSGFLRRKVELSEKGRALLSAFA